LRFAGNGLSIASSIFLNRPQAIPYLISAIQFSFILETLVIAVFSIADRFSPSKTLFTCGLLGIPLI
jgi:hypothetical protein